jgi:phosphate transport system substrate-binding protein
VDREKNSRQTVMAALAAVVVVASIAAMFWIWRTGGAPLGGVFKQSSTLEECGARLSGSSTMGLKLAPAIVGDFLRHTGYQVGPPRVLPDGVIEIQGRRGEVRCTVSIRSLESTTGFLDLASGQAVVALSSRPILAHDKQALARANAGDFDAERALAEHVVALDALAVIVHASNPVERLDTDDVANLAVARMDNWRRVNGPNSPVSVYSTLETTGADDLPNDLVPSAAEVWSEPPSNHHLERDDPALIAKVERDPTAVGFISASFLRDPAPRVRAVRVSGGSGFIAPTVSAMHAQTYALTRRLFVYVRPRDMRENAFVRSFVNYFKSSEAFDRIEQLGFAALREAALADASAVRSMGCSIGAPETASLASTLRGAEKSPVALRFRPNSFQLDAAARADARRLSPELIDKITDGWHIILVGHSDLPGGIERNRDLALDRALAARAAFEGAGVFGLQVESAGENCPIADMETKEGQRINRRVEIWLRSPAQPSAARR